MDSCRSVTKMLRSMGMRPEWTTSGKEAVFRSHMAIDENDPFKVYIIDWLMPDMNGVEVVRRIRKKIGGDVPIIILTAYSFVPGQNASPQKEWVHFPYRNERRDL